MSNDEFDEQFLKLYQLMVERFDKLEAKVDTKADGERVYAALDGIAKRLDTDDAERAAMTAQLNRHEARIEKAAPKLGLSYDP